jgi:hypothetical protein
VTIEKVGVDGGRDYLLTIDDKQADLVGLLVIVPGCTQTAHNGGSCACKTLSRSAVKAPTGVTGSLREHAPPIIKKVQSYAFRGANLTDIRVLPTAIAGANGVNMDEEVLLEMRKMLARIGDHL